VTGTATDSSPAAALATLLALRVEANREFFAEESSGSPGCVTGWPSGSPEAGG